MSGGIYLLGKRQGSADAASIPVTAIGLDGRPMVAPELGLVYLESLLLGALRSVCHVAFVRLLDTVDGADLAAPDEDLAEETAPFLVLQPVDRENLLAVHLRESEDGLDLVETLPELALVEQHHHVRVVDDRLLDDGGADDVLDLLRNHAHGCPELSCGLVHILDVLGHHRGSDGLPGLLDDKDLAVLLDPHLLDEEVHDDKGNQREEKGIVLNRVDLEDDERLVEESGVQVFVQSDFMVSSPVEVLHQVVVGREVDAREVVLLADLGDPLDAELVEGVEVERLNAPCEMVLVVFGYGLLDELVLGLGDRPVRALPDEHDEVLQEAHLLDVVLRARDAERVHGDRMLLGIGDVLASDVLAEALVGVSGVHHHYVSILLPELPDDGVHVVRTCRCPKARGRRSSSCP